MLVFMAAAYPMDSLVVRTSFGELLFYSEPLPVQPPKRITECSDDDCMTREAEKPGEAYYCYEIEKPESEVRHAKVRYNGCVMDLETKDLFNLDSAHGNFLDARILVRRSHTYLVAKMGPAACVHYAVWDLSPRRGKWCGQFGSPIAYDIYSDQKQLMEKASDICK